MNSLLLGSFPCLKIHLSWTLIQLSCILRITINSCRKLLSPRYNSGCWLTRTSAFIFFPKEVCFFPLLLATEEKNVILVGGEGGPFMASCISETARSCCEENKSMHRAKGQWSEGLVLQLTMCVLQHGYLCYLKKSNNHLLWMILSHTALLERPSS